MEIRRREDSLATLRPFLNEIVTDNILKQYVTGIGPTFWSNFSEDMPAGDALDGLLDALQKLNKVVSVSSTTAGLTQCLPAPPPQICGVGSISDTLKTSLCLSIPPFFSELVQKIISESIHVSNESQDDQECAYWEKFQQLTALLQSLNLFHFVVAFAVSSVIEEEVQQQLKKECSGRFDISLLEVATDSLTKRLLNWLCHIFENSEPVLKRWKSQLKFSCYEVFARLRIAELFEIIVDYPDSDSALKDLALCLREVDIKDELISELDKSFRTRLLHPGVNTADIITQYISAVKALRIVDPSGIVLEKVCGPVREYLYNRDDTVRCIVASLTNDSDSELAEELIKGESNAEDCFDDQDFDSWEPDPVDANPNVSSATRKSSDVISLLVNIYGSCGMFVSEYRNLLADRLLQMGCYDISREVCTLELLKQRFGEGSLHFCEVMLKDIGDSKRLHSAISSSTSDLEKGDSNDFMLHGLILSSEFWPAFREENLQLPSYVQRRIESYSREYGRLKGMRKLEWKYYLGTVDIEIQCGEQRLSMTVSPIRAVLIYQFQIESHWNIESLSRVLKAQPSVVRKHIGFWVSQGLLKETLVDEYTLVSEQKLSRKGALIETDYEDESVMETEQSSVEVELQIYWNYITHMLTNLGPLSPERIHSMLGMFGLQGNQAIGLNDLKSFLQKKAVEQQLVFSNNVYSLPK